jgi:TatD DNase family protein
MTDKWTALAPYLRDTHCHLHLYPEADTLADRITELDMHVNCVTTGVDDFIACYDRFDSRPTIRPSLGLFPGYIREEAAHVDRFLELMDHTQLIGEVGLDYVTEDAEDRKLQRDIFERILSKAAEAGDKIISIHSRRAASEVIEMIGDSFPGMAILHWFSGSESDIQNAGPSVYFSVNTAMIKSERARRLVQCMDPTKVLLESDGPFITLDDDPVSPMDITRVAEYLSGIWQMSVEDTVMQIHNNYVGYIV